MFSGSFGNVSNLFAAAAAAANVPSGTLPQAPASTTELNAAVADQLGHSAANADVPTAEAASACITDVRKALDDIPIGYKAAYTYTQQAHPDLIDDEHVFKFLYAEDFNAPAAARRLVRYWNERYKLFGQDKFCLPLTLKGALKDDSLALSRGYVQLLPQPDSAGRALIYVDWSCHEPSVGYSVESMHRVFWYIAHVAMEDDEILKKGLVILIYPQEARLDQFDCHLWKSIAESCEFSLPIRWRSTHIVHPNRFFSIIHPLFMSTLPQSVQDRVIVHSGTKMKVLANLLRYCLPWDRIPSDVGGCVDLDLGVWLSERMVKEDQRGNTPADATSSESGIVNLIAKLQSQSNQGQAAQPVASAQMQYRPDQATGDGTNTSFGNATDQMFPTPAVGTGNDAQTSESAAAKQQGKKKDKIAAKGKPATAKSGRKSDPRMDRAVEAKLADPSMSLLDALRAGGFDIPSSSGASTPQYVVVDGDNVKITQRKNQLLRRLRTAKSSM